ncbi:hypothetical protein Hdeb2414_s0018g00516001 [Helianthus debilis subsp. tardiflorus]
MYIYAMHDSYIQCTLSHISMASHFFFLCTFLTFSLSFHVILGAIPKYVVINEAPTHGGGIKFIKVIGGIPYTQKIMRHINKFIWYKVFKQNTPAEQKPLDNVTVFIKDFVGAEGIAWGNDRINISAVFLRDYPGPMDLKWIFTSLMHHEMTHVFQWNGEGKTPAPLVEGIADYTVLKAKYNPRALTSPVQGIDGSGYHYTARFLEYCDGLIPDFVAKLNNMMKKTYDVSFFSKFNRKACGGTVEGLQG